MLKISQGWGISHHIKTKCRGLVGDWKQNFGDFVVFCANLHLAPSLLNLGWAELDIDRCISLNTSTLFIRSVYMLLIHNLRYAYKLL